LQHPQKSYNKSKVFLALCFLILYLVHPHLLIVVFYDKFSWLKLSTRDLSFRQEIESVSHIVSASSGSEPLVTDAVFLGLSLRRLTGILATRCGNEYPPRRRTFAFFSSDRMPYLSSRPDQMIWICAMENYRREQDYKICVHILVPACLTNPPSILPTCIIYGT
jgi:hypothetical protein